MKLLTVSEGNILEDMLKGEGWKIFQSIVDDLSKNIEREIMARGNSIEKKEDMFKELYCLQDFMKLPFEAIEFLVRHEQAKDIPTQEFDPYHTIKSITKDSE